ncbi:MAG: 5'/3'-nucleotidase SurE [Erysipelotrichaceae bacterium]|nr:5'/3'-nucleotidase SurE [Erysipelotrichaceae bacterium]
MNILISNDDGINSQGLKSIVKAFSRIGDVYVVAPEGERSSNSHHLTCVGKVKIEKRQVQGAKEAYALWGTPADCAYLGLDFLFKDKIDILVSGINVGLNVSTDIVYSGTIAAAREAFIHNVPSIAVSIDYDENVNYDLAADYAVKIAEKYLKDEKKHDYFLNINVPDLPKEEIKGIRVCDKVAIIHYDNNLSMIKENGENFIKLNDVVIDVNYDPEDLSVDYSAVKKGYVAVSPLYNDHFSREYMKHVEKIL